MIRCRQCKHWTPAGDPAGVCKRITTQPGAVWISSSPSSGHLFTFKDFGCSLGEIKEGAMDDLMESFTREQHEQVIDSISDNLLEAAQIDANTRFMWDYAIPDGITYLDYIHTLDHVAATISALAHAKEAKSLWFCCGVFAMSLAVQIDWNNVPPYSLPKLKPLKTTLVLAKELDTKAIIVFDTHPKIAKPENVVGSIDIHNAWY